MSKIHNLYSLQPNVGAAKMNKLKQNKTNKWTVLSKRATITWANEIKCTGIIGIDFQHPPPADPGYPTDASFLVPSPIQSFSLGWAGAWKSPIMEIYYFDCCNEEWSFQELLPPPGFKFGSCASNGHYLYVYGGEDSDCYFTGSLFRIDNMFM